MPQCQQHQVLVVDASNDPLTTGGSRRCRAAAGARVNTVPPLDDSNQSSPPSSRRKSWRAEADPRARSRRQVVKNALNAVPAAPEGSLTVSLCHPHPRAFQTAGNLEDPRRPCVQGILHEVIQTSAAAPRAAGRWKPRVIPDDAECPNGTGPR
jgi:hypothetical protein